MSKRYKPKFEEERGLYQQIEALTNKQGEYITSIYDSPQIVVTGPAGTGKTFIAATMAADFLRQGKIEKIVLTRPNVPAGRTLGLLPGSLEEKIAPWVVPFTDVIKTRMPIGAYDSYLKNGGIDIVPFEIMRGRTFNNAFIILDEAQNTTPVEMKMFLTRIGENCTVIINGDVEQTDLKETSGLKTVIRLVEKYKLPVDIISFSEDDIVRSDICALWVKSFHREGI